jgi:glycosyltransferase involved in cell wall biosynthesis
MPQIAVVMPVYNAAAVVGRAIGSILAQSFSDFELIVVDDGSTDETLAVVQSFRDDRLRAVPVAHQGVALAANTGTAESTARLIARMDADDFAHVDRLQNQFRLLREEEYDVVGCEVNIVAGDGAAVESMQNYQAWINEETSTAERIRALRFVELGIVNPTILARREYFELGYRDGDFPEDYDLFLRAIQEGLRPGKVAEPLLEWTDGPNRLTRTDSRYSSAGFDCCRRHYLLLGPLSNVAVVDLWGVGETGKPWLRWLKACGIAVRRAYDVNPRKQGETIHGTPVYHPDEVLPADGTPLIIAVGAPGARRIIEPQLVEHGYTLGDDAWFVA